MTATSHIPTSTYRHDYTQRGRVARSKNIKKAKFGHKQFQKGQIKAKFPSKKLLK